MCEVLGKADPNIVVPCRLSKSTPDNRSAGPAPYFLYSWCIFVNFSVSDTLRDGYSYSGITLSSCPSIDDFGWLSPHVTGAKFRVFLRAAISPSNCWRVSIYLPGSNGSATHENSTKSLICA